MYCLLLFLDYTPTNGSNGLYLALVIGGPIASTIVLVICCVVCCQCCRDSSSKPSKSSKPPSRAPPNSQASTALKQSSGCLCGILG